MEKRASDTPIAPLPNPGEGGLVAGDDNIPVTPLPNPGEGGPVNGGGSNIPVTPLPNPGEGGPVDPGPVWPGGSGIPIIPLPNPGEGGPVAPGPGIGGIILPIWPRSARVRFLNAAYGYQPFRVLINNYRVLNVLNYASISSYGHVPAGYQPVTVTGMDGYIYIQKTMPFQMNASSTIAVINTVNGLDLLQIPDSYPPANGSGSLRVSNLAYNSGPLDVLLGDGRVIYADVRYKETTASKRIRPGAYQLFFAQTNLMPMPAWHDVETLDTAFIGAYPPVDTVASLYLTVRPNSDDTVFILSSGSAANAVQTLVAEGR